MNDTQRPLLTPQSQLAYWVFQLTGWGFYTLSRFFGGIMVMHLPWVHFGLQLLLVDALGLGLSHVLRDYVRRHQWRALPFRRRAWRILVASFACGIPLGILTQFTDVAALQNPNEILEWMSSALRYELALPVAIALEIVNWSTVFLIWQAIYFTAIAYGNTARRNFDSRNWYGRYNWRNCVCSSLSSIRIFFSMRSIRCARSSPIIPAGRKAP